MDICYYSLVSETGMNISYILNIINLKIFQFIFPIPSIKC
jgi:hypothetical protein